MSRKDDDKPALWLPGAAGVTHQAAIAALVKHQGEAVLTVEKKIDSKGRVTYVQNLTKK